MAECWCLRTNILRQQTRLLRAGMTSQHVTWRNPSRDGHVGVVGVTTRHSSRLLLFLRNCFNQTGQSMILSCHHSECNFWWRCHDVTATIPSPPQNPTKQSSPSFKRAQNSQRFFDPLEGRKLLARIYYRKTMFVSRHLVANVTSTTSLWSNTIRHHNKHFLPDVLWSTPIICKSCPHSAECVTLD